MKTPVPLYDICVKAAVINCSSGPACNCKREFRSLPNNVLFDFFYTMLQDKRLCLLSVEFSDLEIFTRMLTVKHKRIQMLKTVQALICHESPVLHDLIQNYMAYSRSGNRKAIAMGIEMATFFNEGGWYDYTIKALNVTEEVCKKQQESIEVLQKCLECYHRRFYAETIYCQFGCAEKTFASSLLLIDKLTQLKALPNMAEMYAHFSTLHFHRSEYDEAFTWSKKALRLLDDKLPTRVIVEVLRQASRACVVKRRFDQADLLIRQAVNLASNLYKVDKHPRYADTLLDFGFYLLNYDSIQESVKVYEKSLEIRREVFERSNINLALAYEDLAYALYVHEYSSGRFYAARETADRSIKQMEKILPGDHLMLASAKRVKALILEEIALDLRDDSDQELQTKYLSDAEELHKTALSLSLKAFGEKNVQTAKHYGNLGRLYQSMKLFPEAEQMHLRAIAIKEELLGTEDYEVGLSIGHLASLYNYHMERYEDAEKLYLRSLEINMNLFGDAYSGLEYDYRGLIHVYNKTGDVCSANLYKPKLREWNDKRAEIRPAKYTKEILPFAEIVETFFSLDG